MGTPDKLLSLQSPLDFLGYLKGCFALTIDFGMGVTTEELAAGFGTIASTGCFGTGVANASLVIAFGPTDD